MFMGSAYEYTYKDLTTKSGLGVSAPATQANPVHTGFPVPGCTKIVLSCAKHICDQVA